MLTHPHNIGQQVEYPVILSVSAGVQEVVNQLRFLEILQDSQFDAEAALVTWKTMETLDRDELIKLEGVPYVYFDKDSLVGFLPDRSLPYVQNYIPFGPWLKEKYPKFMELTERI